jgi:SAM-dependent methyltransferase
METENQLELIAKSYDRHFIEYEKNGSLSYDNLPDYITNSPNYKYWKNESESNWQDNRRIELKDYLAPAKNMNFIQLGCSMNLKTKGYYKWPSVYYGVDISNETIQTLRWFVSENNISIGSLYCGSVHETPFAESYFDIGECIGVLEYYEKDFVLKAIKEFYRLLKPGGKFVLDIPNIESPSGQMMMSIEECMGRPDKFDMLPGEFEDMIKDYFEIEDSDRIRAENCGESHMQMMYFYCLKNKK